jgi:hypothetical protein
MGERARTLSGSALAMLAAAAITLSAYYLAVAKNAPPTAKTAKSETLVYLYKPGPAVARHRWFTVPGSTEKFCGMADGAQFSALIPCTAKDLREDRQHESR